MERSEKLFIADTLIGELQWGNDGDFPWAKGWFIPSPAFKSFEIFFENVKSSNDESYRRLDIFALEKAGYTSADLKIDDGVDICYLVGLNYYADGSAAWRFSMSPLEDE